MIVEFSIKNFGSIKDRQTLSMVASKDVTLESYYVSKVAGVRLMKMAILYGPNASGKTTVLKALDFLRDLVVNTKKNTDKFDQIKFKPFQFDSVSKQDVSEIYLDFIQKNQRFQYKVAFMQTHIVSEQLDFYRTEKKPALLYSRTTDAAKQLSKVQFGEKSGVKSKDAALIEGNTIWNDTVLRAFSRTNVDIPLLRAATEWFKETLMPIVTPNTKLTSWAGGRLMESPELRATVLELIAKADFQISNFEIKNDEIEMRSEKATHIRTLLKSIVSNPDEVLENSLVKVNKMDVVFQHKIMDPDGIEKEFELSDDDQSHGTMRFFGLSTLLSVAINNSRVLNIDELDTSLHPELMKHFILIALANTQNAQIIFTTHNILLLSERDILRNDAIWFTEKQGDGSTELYSAADFGSTTLRSDGSIINAYKQGRLGARPDPGSIFLTTKPDVLN